MIDIVDNDSNEEERKAAIPASLKNETNAVSDGDYGSEEQDEVAGLRLSTHAGDDPRDETLDDSIQFELLDTQNIVNDIIKD